MFFIFYVTFWSRVFFYFHDFDPIVPEFSFFLDGNLFLYLQKKLVIVGLNMLK